MPEIAVLIAAYNAALTLPECLDSLSRQTLKAFQVICVDDCSTDDTLDLLHQRAAEDARFIVLQTPLNSGQAVARNLALEQVTAPYVCMLDADDWLSPDALQSAVDAFHAHPLADCIVFRLHRVFPDGREEVWPLPHACENGSPFSGKEAFDYCMNGWQLHGLYAVRTSLHRQIPFDTATRLYSDDNTSRLHYLHSREVRACDGIYYYRQHEESMTSSFNIHRFDFMEANLSLLFALQKEDIPRATLQRFEGHRWLTFITCYRLYLNHLDELSPDDCASLHKRFTTVLHTFRPSRLPLCYRWKPGYWLTLSLRRFDLQQRLYLWASRLKHRGSVKTA